MFFNTGNLLNYNIEYVRNGKVSEVVVKATDKKDALRKLVSITGCDIVVRHVGPVLIVSIDDNNIGR